MTNANRKYQSPGRNTIRLSLIPPPAKKLTAKKARLWIDLNLPGFVEVAGYLGRDEDILGSFLNDLTRIVRGCTQAIATGRPVRFGRQFMAYDSNHVGEIACCSTWPTLQVEQDIQGESIQRALAALHAEFEYRLAKLDREHARRSQRTVALWNEKLEAKEAEAIENYNDATQLLHASMIDEKKRAGLQNQIQQLHEEVLRLHGYDQDAAPVGTMEEEATV